MHRLIEHMHSLRNRGLVPITFLTWACCVAYGNLFEWVLGGAFTVLPKYVIAIGLGIVPALIVGWAAVTWWRNRQLVVSAVQMSHQPTRRRGLILLVGRLPVCEKAIDFHWMGGEGPLERVWLVCSDQSAGDAERLVAKYSTLCDPTLRRIADVYDVREYYDTIRAIYRDRKPADWLPDDVICDMTGMTACGSIGMTLACLGRDRPLQYTPASYNAALNATMPLDPVELQLAWHPVEFNSRQRSEPTEELESAHG